MLRALEFRVSLACVTSAVIVSFFLSVNGLSDSAWSSIDSLIQDEFLVAFQTPGLGLAVVNRSEVDDQITGKGYGLMDMEAGVKTGNDTKFFIASISKSFTAVLACKLLNEKFPDLGEAVLDTPIVELTPDFNFTLIDKYMSQEATFRDLLSHRTCLYSYGIGGAMGAYSSRADEIYRARYIPEVCSFRSTLTYSNVMPVLAGEVLGHIAKVPFENLVENFFEAVGMTESLVTDSTSNYDTVENMSRGYYRDFGGELAKMPAAAYNHLNGAAAGGIISTPTDMGKYMLFHLNNGRVGDIQIVPEEVLHWAYKSSNLVQFSGHRTLENDDFTGEYAYGLGLYLGTYNGWHRISHDGDLSPFTARMTLYPDLGVGIFTSTNGPLAVPQGVGHYNLHNQIMGILFPDSVKSSTDILEENWRSVRRVSPKHSITKSIPSQRIAKVEAENFVGIYGHPYEGDIQVLLNESSRQLYFEYGNKGRGSLLTTDTVNVYLVEWEGLIRSFFLGSFLGPPLPNTTFDFGTEQKLLFRQSYLEYLDVTLEYGLDATIETYPEVPWEEDTCEGRGGGVPITNGFPLFIFTSVFVHGVILLY